MRPALALLLFLAVPARAQPAFDYYLLSLSLAPSFCALSVRNAGTAECRHLTPDAFRRTPLTLHGLWPNRARLSANRQPQDCPGPDFAISPDTRDALRDIMPAGPGLARHEWRRHGTCSGLSADRYFAAAAAWTARADAAYAPLLQGAGPVRLDDLRRAAPAMADSVIVDCRTPTGGGPALLEEIRLTLDRDGNPIPAASVGLGQNSGCPRGQGDIPRP